MTREYLEGEAGYSGLPDHDYFFTALATVSFSGNALTFVDQTNPGSGDEFLSQGIIIANDGMTDIEFSWDGSFVCGVVKPGEVLTFDNRHKRKVFVRGTVGGERFRFWAW